MSFEAMKTIAMALATILAPLVTLAVKRVWDNKNITSISSARKKAISRTWNGFLWYDANNKKSKPVPITLYLESKGKIVSGRACYDSSNGETELLLRGRFYSDSLLKLDFRNSYEHKLHFGVMILELNANSDRMEGANVAYGRSPDGIFTAVIKLKVS